MLRVIGSTGVKHCTVEVEDYLPLAFRCVEVASHTPLYWRTGDFKHSLIEIGLNQVTGAICKVTIPLLGKLSKSIHNPVDGTIVSFGIPLCDITGWSKDRFKDEAFSFTAFIAGDSVSIWIAPQAPLAACYEIGNLSFAVDREGYLRLLRFRDLSSFDIDRITKTVP